MTRFKLSGRCTSLWTLLCNPTDLSGHVPFGQHCRQLAITLGKEWSTFGRTRRYVLGRPQRRAPLLDTNLNRLLDLSGRCTYLTVFTMQLTCLVAVCPFRTLFAIRQRVPSSVSNWTVFAISERLPLWLQERMKGEDIFQKWHNIAMGCHSIWLPRVEQRSPEARKKKPIPCLEKARELSVHRHYIREGGWETVRVGGHNGGMGDYNRILSSQEECVHHHQYPRQRRK